MLYAFLVSHDSIACSSSFEFVNFFPHFCLKREITFPEAWDRFFNLGCRTFC